MHSILSAENILPNRYGLPPSSQAAFPIVETLPVQTLIETIAKGEENALSIPTNSRLSAKDQYLQYTHGFNPGQWLEIRDNISTNPDWVHKS